MSSVTVLLNPAEEKRCKSKKSLHEFPSKRWFRNDIHINSLLGLTGARGSAYIICDM